MNPGHKSPQEVCESVDYQGVTPQGVFEETYYPSSAAVVVMDVCSGKTYRAVYSVGVDDSDWDQPTSWTEVVLVPVQRDVWRVKK